MEEIRRLVGFYLDMITSKTAYSTTYVRVCVLATNSYRKISCWKPEERENYCYVIDMFVNVLESEKREMIDFVKSFFDDNWEYTDITNIYGTFLRKSYSPLAPPANLLTDEEWERVTGNLAVTLDIILDALRDYRMVEISIIINSERKNPPMTSVFPQELTKYLLLRVSLYSDYINMSSLMERVTSIMGNTVDYIYVNNRFSIVRK